MSYADLAEQSMREGYNCAQAVAAAFSDLLADQLSKEQLLSLAAPFGGGFAGQHCLCGALAGTGIVYGLLRGSPQLDPDREIYDRMAIPTERFMQKHATVVCAELTASAEARGEEKKEACIGYVRTAAELLAERLRDEGCLQD